MQCKLEATEDKEKPHLAWGYCLDFTLNYQN